MYLAAPLSALSLLLVIGCPGGALITDDDATGDDDMWTDDDDTADDDDIGEDDDSGDDDAADGDPCTTSFGPPEMPIEVTGTCGQSPDLCEGGFDPQNGAGTCAAGLTCCVDTDQCETAIEGTCAATEDECEGEPPPGAPGFPQLGCPPAVPFCCVPGPPR